MHKGDFDEDYNCPGCGAPSTGDNLCADCSEEDEHERLWNASHNLYHGPSDDQLRRAKDALERGECTTVTLFFSLDERDEDGSLVHITSLTRILYAPSWVHCSPSWNFEGTQWCKNFKHPEGGQSPVRGTWDPMAKNGLMEFQIPSPPVCA